MIPYAQLRFGRGFVPGHAASYFVQRCVTHPTVRRCVASVLAAGVRSRHATLATRREPDLQDALGSLERDGIAMLPNLFSTAELADVVGFFLSQPVAAPGGGCVAFSHCCSLPMADDCDQSCRYPSACFGVPRLQADSLQRWYALVIPWLKIARRDAGVSSRSR